MFIGDQHFKYTLGTKCWFLVGLLYYRGGGLPVTISSLTAEYAVCTATISNWIRIYREEYETNNAAKTELELMQEVRMLRQKLKLTEAEYQVEKSKICNKIKDI